MAIKEKGLEFLQDIRKHDHYQMQNLKVNKFKLQKRAEWAASLIKKRLDTKKKEVPVKTLNEVT
jgi:ubiquinone biosynthesis protein COQ9